MAESTRQKAVTLIIVVGSATTGVLIALAGLWLVGWAFNIESSVLLDWFVSLVVAVLGGSAGWRAWTKRRGSGGDDAE